MLFATDFSSASEAVLSHAVAIVRRYRSKLYVAHVTPPELYRSVPDEILKEAVKRTEDYALHEMSRLISLGDCGNYATGLCLRKATSRILFCDWFGSMPSTCW